MPIGTLAEKSLHAALKAHYAQPDDYLEHTVDGYVIDIVRPSGACVEIQTRSLGKLKPKLIKLLDRYPIHVVYPIAQERFIVRVESDGEVVSRRKSPKRGTIYHVFPELVSWPALIAHPHFSMDVVFIREEEYWINNGQGSWRRKRWSIQDRYLLDILQTIPLTTPANFVALIPANLPDPFGSQDLARTLRIPRTLAQKMLYCLREMGILHVTGKQGNNLLYQLNPLWDSQHG
jgi:hypothetical protein